MTDHSPPTRREDFKIAVICALSIEGDAVEALFDKIWDDEDCALGKEQTDRNTYTMGLIGHHNVVLTWMRGIGKVSAARAATDLENSFKGIKLSLVVGICGGVPHTSGGEILLGDVIVSTGINQYDLVKRLPGGVRRRSTDRAISSVLSKLQGTRGRRRLTENTLIYLKELLGSGDFQTAQYPGANEDKLYKATYRHEHHELSSCDSHICGVNKDGVCDKALDSSCVELKCDERELLPRDQRMERASGGPLIHFGLVASGDTVMKSGEHRDEIAAAKNVIAFEMEGAGVWDTFEYVFVIKGVCDYADSHKNKKWQRYAALTGAACMKALLKESMFLGKPSQAKEIANQPEGIRPPPSPSDNIPKSIEPPIEEFPSLNTNSPNSLDLLRACEHRNIDHIKELLEKKDTSLNATGDRGRGVLHFALGVEKVNAKMEEDAANIVRLLLTHGADLNAQDGSGLRPIHYCAKSINSKAAMFLLDKGAQINEPDKQGRTALHHVAIDGNPNVKFAKMLIDNGGKLGSARLPDLRPRANTRQREVRALAVRERVPVVSKKPTCTLL